MTSHFDPSLLYAECRKCGSPVLKKSAPTDELLWMGIAPESLDADCVLLYDGCPNCAPEAEAHEPRFVRLRRREIRPAAH